MTPKFLYLVQYPLDISLPPSLWQIEFKVMTLKGLKKHWWFHSLVVSVQRQRHPAGEFSRGTGESIAMWVLPIYMEPEYPE